MSISRRPRHRWYAAAYEKLIEPMDRKTMAPLRRTIAGGARGRILEIGAGTGVNLEYYDWSMVEKLDVTEPDPYMLQKLRVRAGRLPADVREHIQISDAPAEALPFEDGSFDVAVVTLVLCTVSDPQVAISEIRRVLKPGSELRLIEHVRADGRWRGVQRLVQPVYGHLAGDCQLTRDTEALVRNAGFDLDIGSRQNLGGPLWPSFAGIAIRRA